MKRGPVTRLDKKNKKYVKKLTLTSCQKIVMSLSFFEFLDNLEPTGGRRPDTESTKIIFLVIVTFCLTIT